MTQWYSKDKIKEALSLENIFTLLNFLGAEPKREGNVIVSKTICHGGDSKKMYWYDNSRLFYCYTHCGKFDVFELIQKVGLASNFYESICYIACFFNIPEEENNQYTHTTRNPEDWKLFRKYESYVAEKVQKNDYTAKPCNPSVLKHLPQPIIKPWEDEHISSAVCNFLNIKYDPEHGCIVIPHEDINGHLIGIRQRTLLKSEEDKGKYRPWYHDNILYGHPLGFNLYGLNYAKNNISKLGIAIVVESEKSVLQYMSYFGIENNICVATCGNSVSRYQFNLLKKCGAKEIVIGFDKDFRELGDDNFIKVVKHLQQTYNKFSAEVNISFLFDKENKILPYKGSPTDVGKEKFLYLFKNRVVI